MPVEHKQGFCKQCDQLRPVQRSAPHHLVHFIMSILTAGLWLVIWFLASFRITAGWRCEHCGASKVSKVH